MSKSLAFPVEHKHNFIHLALDIGWYGVLAGSSLSFLSVYFVRIGADGVQVGLLSALPAVVTLMVALPTAQWLKNLQIDRAVFWSSVAFRLFYAAWIPLPLLASTQGQIWLALTITFLMSVPGTALAVGFNALFAETVPPEWRGRVAGIRNALLAVSSTLTALLCGYLLETMPFPLGYQIVFLVGFIGALLSSYHLWKIRTTGHESMMEGRNGGLAPSYFHANPGTTRTVGETIRHTVGMRYLLRLSHVRLPQIDVLRSPFGVVLFCLFVFHLTQYLAIPVFPLYWVEILDLTDQDISMGNALFYLFVFLGSLLLGRLVDWWKNHRVLAVGAMAMALYPGITALATTREIFFLASVVGGAAWALAGGALANYILEKIPGDNRPNYLAWYTLALNTAILLGAILGPMVARQIGLGTALGIFALGRFLSAVGIYRFGR